MFVMCSFALSVDGALDGINVARSPASMQLEVVSSCFQQRSMSSLFSKQHSPRRRPLLTSAVSSGVFSGRQLTLVYS